MHSLVWFAMHQLSSWYNTSKSILPLANVLLGWKTFSLRFFWNKLFVSFSSRFLNYFSLSQCNYYCICTFLYQKVIDCNRARTHNYLVCKRTLNHLAKLVPLPSLKLQIWRLFRAFRFRAFSLDIQATKECGFILKCVSNMIRTYSQKVLFDSCSPKLAITVRYFLPFKCGLSGLLT